jgi:beta-glucosidase
MIIFFGIIFLLLVYFLLLFFYKDKSITININSLNYIEDFKFPKNFLWGTSTSSYQIEGNIRNNNWWFFENNVSKKKIKTMHQYPQSCLHWEKYKEDIQIMKEIGLNSYRFSLEWSRIQPEENIYDESAIQHYSDIIDELIKNDIKPMVTLHHFTNPIWFEKKGAFLNVEASEIFLKYVEKVVITFKDRIELWCTFNEPSIYALNGYFTGLYPPGLKDAKKAAKVYGNILKTHNQTYNLIKSISPASQVGLVINYIIFEAPHSLNLFDVIADWFLNESINDSQLKYLQTGEFRFFFPLIVNEKMTTDHKESFDFIGLNYYTRSYLKFRLNKKKMFEVLISESKNGHSDLNWEIYPEGLYRALNRIKKYTDKPVYITENGIADTLDTKRSEFISDHIKVLIKALSDGYDIRGYYYWSLLDNYEWGFGFDAKFGLVEVDLDTQERKIKKSAKTYSEFIKKYS